MRKLLAAVVVACFVAADTTPVFAQAVKPTEKKQTESKGSGGTITIKPDAKGRYRLLVKNAEGKSLLMTAGNGFETEEEAKEAIEAIKKILASGKVVVEKGK